MKTQEITTTDFADFGSREREMVIEILLAWKNSGLPTDFYQDEVRPTMNKNSGFVFLVNSEYQTAMLNGNVLEIWHNCHNCGHEGFAEDCQLNDDGCENCCPSPDLG
jgi:hypothetical protein